MSIIQSVILAIVQALTEFIPVSSSGHLIIMQELFSFDPVLAFDIALHVGTLLALIIYYRKKLLYIINDIKNGNYQLATLIAISSVPAVLVALMFSDAITGDIRSLNTVIGMLILVGIVMLYEDKLLPKKPTKTIYNITKSDALVIGLFQSMALIPGTSRSGATIIGGRYIGLSNSQAADYGFIIGIVAIAGAAAKTLTESESINFINNNTIIVLVGVVVAAVVGWLAIDFVLKVLKRVGLKWFGLYRIVLALLLIILI